MALSPGTRVGPYDIVALLGAGGMGEVYRARDPKLNRDVAIKVLRPTVANDPDRRARFSREARVLASLNHPHIAQIHGFEDSGDIPALVMELVEGPTLADRIGRGAIPLDEALPMARQIAEALEAAHEQGIVHRDLKPANIKVRDDGMVKVLDFGLAKALDPPSGADGDPMDSPTISVHATEAGVILGTAAYMSPEQAKGRPADKRADLWAFGVVLYEMLTGVRPFRGDGATDTIASVITRDPDWSALPANTPAAIRRLLRRCLEKDRKQRLDSAHAARLDINEALSPAAETRVVGPTPAGRFRTLAMITAVVGTAVITTVVTWIATRPIPTGPVLPSRFAIVAPATRSLNASSPDRDVALSPDGRQIVYRAGGSSDMGAPLMLRTADQLDAHQLVAEASFGPFFSPDNLWVGFFANSEIKKVSVAGGPAIVIGPYTGRPLGGSWGDDNTIVFATDDPSSGLWRVSADGGQPVVLTTPVAAQRQADHAFPSVLSKGRGVLFTITPVDQGDTAQVAMLDAKTGQITTLVRDGSHAEYIDPSAGVAQAGYLIYTTAGALRAVRFDAARREVRGEPVTVVDRVSTKATGAANFAVSRQGTLLYVPSGVVGASQTPRSLVWVDRLGREEPLNTPLHAYGPPRVSPDGTRLAFNTFDQDNPDIWIWHLARETMTRLTFASGTDGLPVWTPDSQRIIFDSAREGVLNLYSQSADGTGTAHRFTTSTNPQFPSSVTADGKTAVGFERAAGVKTPKPAAPGQAFWVMLYPMANPSGAESSTQPLFHGAWPEVSPDGRYIAYQSEGPGRSEIFVRPFPDVDGGLWQISTAGGTRVVWARNGRELFYLDLANTLTAVPVKISGSMFSAGKPAKVFDAKYAVPGPPRHYDVSPDGLRFLMLKNSPTGDPNATPASMVVILNWFEELKSRVPIK